MDNVRGVTGYACVSAGGEILADTVRRLRRDSIVALVDGMWGATDPASRRAAWQCCRRLYGTRCMRVTISDASDACQECRLQPEAESTAR